MEEGAEGAESAAHSPGPVSVCRVLCLVGLWGLLLVAGVVVLGYATRTCGPPDSYRSSRARHDRILKAARAFVQSHDGRYPESLDELVNGHVLSRGDLGYSGKDGVLVRIQYLRPLKDTPDHAVLLYDERSLVPPTCIPEDSLATDLKGRQWTFGEHSELSCMLFEIVPRHKTIWRAIAEYAEQHGGAFPQSLAALIDGGLVSEKDVRFARPDGSIVAIEYLGPPWKADSSDIVLYDAVPTTTQRVGIGLNQAYVVVTTRSGQTGMLDAGVVRPSVRGTGPG